MARMKKTERGRHSELVLFLLRLSPSPIADLNQGRSAQRKYMGPWQALLVSGEMAAFSGRKGGQPKAKPKMTQRENRKSL